MARTPLWRFDGETPVRISKAEVNEWIVRARTGAAQFRAAADRGDLQAMAEWACEASGSAAELQSIADATALMAAAS